MADKRATYVEPAGYFNSSMKKAEKEWDKQKAGTKKQAKKPATTKKK